MSSQDASAAGGETSVTSQARETRPATPGSGVRVRTWFLVMGLALLAGAAGWLVGERTMEYSKLSRAAAENIGGSYQAMNAEMPGVSAVNGALTFGVLGGLLGLAMGLGGGLSSQSSGRTMMGTFAGLVLGSLAGALPSLVVMPWHWRHRNDDPAGLELLVPMLMHLALWSAAGLAAGLAFGLGYGARPVRLLSATLAGLVGAMIGTCVFEIVGALLLPFAHTTDPFSSTSGSRLLARLCVAGFVALGVIASLPSSTVRRPESAASQA